MLRNLRHISFVQYVLIAIICVIMTINTNFSAISKVKAHIELSDCSLEDFLSSLIDCMQNADYGSSNNLADSAAKKIPLEEESGSSEDELISHALEDHLAEIIHVLLNTNVANDTSHR